MFQNLSLSKWRLVIFTCTVKKCCKFSSLQPFLWITVTMGNGYYEAFPLIRIEINYGCENVFYKNDWMTGCRFLTVCFVTLNISGKALSKTHSKRHFSSKWKKPKNLPVSGHRILCLSNQYFKVSLHVRNLTDKCYLY